MKWWYMCMNQKLFWQTHSFIDITEEDKAQFMEIKTQIKSLDGVENACKLPDGLQSFLKTHVQAWNVQKHTAARGSTRAIVQDARLRLQRVSDEVCLIHDYLMLDLHWSCSSWH